MDAIEQLSPVDDPATEESGIPLPCRSLDPAQKYFLTQEEFKDIQRGIIIVAQEHDPSPLDKILRANLQAREKEKAASKASKKGQAKHKENTRTPGRSLRKAFKSPTKAKKDAEEVDEGEDDDEEEEAQRPEDEDDDEDDEDDLEESLMFSENRSRFSVIANYFDCTIDGCGETFGKKKDRNNHVRTVHQIEPYCCPLNDCNERTNNSHQYAKHLMQKHPGIHEWICEICPTNPRFRVYQAFWKHNYTLHESGEFGCPFKDCTFTARVRKPVYNHVAHKHPDLKYVCYHEGCEKVFSNPSEMMSHQLRAHLFLKPFKCTWPDCGYSSEVSSATLRHIRAVHFNVPSVKVQRENNMIDQRDPREFLQRLVDPKRILACYGPIDNTDKERTYKCPLCPQVYRRKFNLMVHERVHTGVRPFRCTFDDCGEQFIRREHAYSHIRTIHFNLKSRRSKKRDKNSDKDIDANQFIEVIPEPVVAPETIFVEEESAANYHQEQQITQQQFVENEDGQIFLVQTSGDHDEIIELYEHQEEEALEPDEKRSKIDENVIQILPAEAGKDQTSQQTPLTSLLIHTSDTGEFPEADMEGEEVIIEFQDEESYPVPLTKSGRQTSGTKKTRPRAKMSYRCPHDACRKEFSRPSALKHHIRSHSGAKPYSCSFTSPEVNSCDFTSGRKENLIQHIRTKHFNLPRSLKQQSEMRIVDQRDPAEFVRVDPTMLNNDF